MILDILGSWKPNLSKKVAKYPKTDATNETNLLKSHENERFY